MQASKQANKQTNKQTNKIFVIFNSFAAPR